MKYLQIQKRNKTESLQQICSHERGDGEKNPSADVIAGKSENFSGRAVQTTEAPNGGGSDDVELPSGAEFSSAPRLPLLFLLLPLPCVISDRLHLQVKRFAHNADEVEAPEAEWKKGVGVGEG